MAAFLLLPALLLGLSSLRLAASGPEPVVASPQGATAVSIKVEVDGRPQRVRVELAPDGGIHYVLHAGKPGEQRFTPDEFARWQLAHSGVDNAITRILNVSSWLGVAVVVVLGFGGQILFTGRMLVQLLASEKRGRSHVPEAFWWLSLGGSVLLSLYFGWWRRDIVGFLGQCFGFTVYVRNLMLIRSPRGLSGDEAAG